MPGDTEPCYVISVAARMVGVHAQSLRYYEKMGLIAPSRPRGRRRLYSQKDLERVRQIQTLMRDLGVNLAGVQVILQMMERLSVMEEELHRRGVELEEVFQQPRSLVRSE